MTLGKYELQRRGEYGPLGAVFWALDRNLGRRVVLKFRSSGGADDEAESARLAEVVRSLARISHPYVLPVWELGRWRGGSYVALGHEDGQWLRTWVAEPGRTWSQVVEVMIQVGHALVAMQRSGVDLDGFGSEQVLVDTGGRAQVLGGLFSRDGSRRGGLKAAFFTAASEALSGMPSRANERRADSTRHRAMRFDGPRWLRKFVLRGLEAPAGSLSDDLRELESALHAHHTRTRGARWGGLIVSMALALWVGSNPASQVCEGSENAFRGVWDGPTKSRVRGAFESAKVGYAMETWERVESQLDRYRDAWIAQHRNACQATRVQDLQHEDDMDLRMSCLDRGIAELSTLVGMLEQADATIVQKASSAARGLGPPGDCADAQTLRASMPEPRDAQLRAAARGLRRELSRVRSFAMLGRYADGLDRARGLWPKIEHMAFKPLASEWHATAATFQTRLANHDQAVAHLDEALVLALATGYREQAAEVGNSLLFAKGYLLGTPEAAESSANFVRSLIRSAGDPPGPLAEHYRVRAILHGMRGEHDRSAEMFAAALESFREAYGEYDGSVGDTYGDLSMCRLLQYRFEEALEFADKALAIGIREYGAKHPQLAWLHNNRTEPSSRLGRLRAASESSGRAVRVCEDSHGSGHIFCAGYRVDLGKSLARMGDYRQAESALQPALEVQTREGKRGPPWAVWVPVLLSEIARERGALADARAHARQALRRAAKEPHAFAHLHAHALRSAAEAELAAGDPDAATAYLTRAFDALRVPSTKRSLEWPELLLTRGRIELARGRARAALATIEEALQLQAGIVGESSYWLAAPQLELGRAHLALGNLHEASEHLERARVSSSLARGMHAHRVIPISVATGELMLAQGRFEAARASFEDARARFDPRQLRARRSAELEFGLARASWELGRERHEEALNLAKQALEGFRSEVGGSSGAVRVEVWLQSRD